MTATNIPQLELSNSDKIDVLLSHYEQMREETRMIHRESHQRIMRGIATIAVIMGSVFVEPAAILLFTVLPFVIWFLFIRDIQDAIWIVRIQSQIVRVQHRLNVVGFDWEQEYGFMADARESTFSAPNLATAVFSFCIYLVSTWLGVHALNNADLKSILGVSIPALALLLLYGLLGVVGTVALYSYFSIESAERTNALQLLNTEELNS